MNRQSLIELINSRSEEVQKISQQILNTLHEQKSERLTGLLALYSAATAASAHFLEEAFNESPTAAFNTGIILSLCMDSINSACVTTLNRIQLKETAKRERN